MGLGGLGVFEYGPKGFPHALMHAPELVTVYGHHGACCTCVGEAGHKLDVKSASKYGRTYGDKNESQDDMLKYVQRQELWSAVADLANTDTQDDDHELPARTVPIGTLHKLRFPLPYDATWRNMNLRRGKPPPMWAATFLSSQVLVTRNEVLTLFRSALDMDPTWDSIARLTKLNWDFYGAAELRRDSYRRNVVGVSTHSRGRRDFVRLKGSENGAALSDQVIMFVRVTGFLGESIAVPDHMLTPEDNTCTTNMVVLALVRWLSPHVTALERDTCLRPLCPPPFDINHTLWTFARAPRQRPYFSDNLFARQLHLFPGSNVLDQRQSASTMSHAMFDFVTLESIDTYMNCTPVDNDPNCLMESITLAFQIIPLTTQTFLNF